MIAQATEAQAEAAIAILKRAIDAAENSNQAGENAVVLFAAAPDLLAFVEQIAQRDDSNGDEARALVAKARGASS